MATNANRETLIDYLRDAYAMEQQALSIIDRQLQRLEHYPQLSQGLQRHRAETESQAERLEACLHRLGADTSAIKTGVAKLAVNMQALMNTFASDEVMKDMISNYTFESYEIVNYKILAATAREVGEPEIERIATEILREEEAMQAWVDQQIPVVTAQYLAREANHDQRAAKR